MFFYDLLLKLILIELHEEDELKDKDYRELFEYLIGELKERYEEKMGVLHPEQRDEIERILYLQVLDNAWREHLYQMDILKTGIGLRGYNQKDPLVEYKKRVTIYLLNLLSLLNARLLKLYI